MPLTKKLLIIFGIVLLSTLIATFIYKRQNSGEWIKIQESKITEAIYGLATLESDEIFRYRVGVTSQIKKIFVKEGMTVQKGDVLLQLSEGALLRTPIDGVVTQLDTKENETVFPNINLVTVMNLKKVALTITLEQKSAIRVSPSLPVKIQFESVKGTPIEGSVRSVYPKEGQFIVKVDLKDTPASILPGMTADTAIIVGEKQNALVVPMRSLHRGILTIRENGKVKKIRVNTGFHDSLNIEVIDSPDALIKAGMEVWVSKK